MELQMNLKKKTPRPSFATPPERILIIKPSAIGDVVHALPILNLLRRRWPASHISWLVTPGCAGLLDGHPQLDEVITFDRKLFGNSWKSFSAAKKLAAFSLSLRNKKFDLVIDLQGLFRSGLLTGQTGSHCRVGSTSAREFGWMFCTHLAPVVLDNQHAVDRYLSVAEFLGLGRSPVEFIFPTDDSDRRFVADLLPGDEPFAVILPATHWQTKRWPIEHFASLINPLQERFGLKTILAGGPDAAALAPSLPNITNLAGKTNLRQLVALLERAALVIANDTGPMHIASALGRPLVTMFGPTTPHQTGPYERLDSVVQLDIPCSPCFSRTCSHQTCLKQLTIEPVLALAAIQLHQRTSQKNKVHLPSPGNAARILRKK
jgi:lipopolysaccharide heptosyltransferase I